MNASETSQDTRQALELAQTGFDMVNAQVHGLFGIIFEDPTRSLNAFVSLQSKGMGPEHIIRILNDDGILGRRWHFGFMKGELFARGSREDARKALEELPEALRERKILGDKVRNLVVAYQAALNREDQRRFAMRPRETGRPRR